jgi:RecQ family ATP-dependent DNA helicase
MLWTDKAKKILQKHWKINNLKDKQIEVINNLLLGKDVIGLLPTGYGKSMCYLIPPLVTKKIIFIISPLISLMEDQRDKLSKLGIISATLNSNNKNKDSDIQKIISGDIKIVYMSPEYLSTEGMKLADILINNPQSSKLGFIAIDESHCISGWGHDFRPEYANLVKFRLSYPNIPILAVTATATVNVCNDIVKMLQLKNPKIIKASFNRPNLYIEMKINEISKYNTKESIISNYIKKYPNEKIIIYINSRDETEDISNKLNIIHKNISLAYHAGLNKEKRESIQSKFASGEIKIIVSTIAFGLGIDQIVKCVIIFGCPSSIEEYYQQIGRGGRDGNKCETVLYFDYSKLKIGKYILDKNIKDKSSQIYKVKLNNMNKIKEMVYNNTCRRKYILEYFNEMCDFFYCNNCDNCCNNEMEDLTNILYNDLIIKNINLMKIKNTYFSNDYDIKLLESWINYIKENNISKEKCKDYLRLKFPKQILNSSLQSNTLQSNNIDYFEKFEKLNI